LPNLLQISLFDKTVLVESSAGAAITAMLHKSAIDIAMGVKLARLGLVIENHIFVAELLI